jgi:transcriptional regulator with XRE-family HTH domain
MNNTILTIDNANLSKIGSYLQTIRIQKNLSQQYVANEIQISKAFLSGIENNDNLDGRGRPSFNTLIKLFKLYNIEFNLKVNL